MNESDDTECTWWEGQAQVWQDENGRFAAPLGSTTSGRLVFPSGASQADLRGDPEIPDLFRAHFGTQMPYVYMCSGSVIIRYRRFAILDWLVFSPQPNDEIRLNSRIPWEIEFHNGVSRTTADLRGLQLRSLDILGGASQLSLSLPKPLETAFIYIAGGASKVTIYRPAGVCVRLQVYGGVARLAFDDLRFGAIGGETQLESPGFKSTESRIEINISGGARNLTIGLENNVS